MFKKIAVAATIAMLSTAAFAADAPKMYAGVDVGSTKVDGFSDRETSVGGFFGYQINTNFGIEAGFRRLADFDVDSVGVTIDQTALSAIGTLPLSGGFNVYGRLGYNHLKAKGNGSATDSGALYGVGVGYDFTPTIAGRLEVQKPSSDSTNFSAGVVFKF